MRLRKPCLSLSRASNTAPLSPVFLWDDRRSFWRAMATESRLFVVARNKDIAPKQRRVERIPPGYSIREFYNNPRGRYWYVVTTLEVLAPKKRLPSSA